jgi:drug/metabolite transporter (DMT)-like permease
LLNSTVPLWVAIVTYLIYRKHLSKSTIVGLGAGFGGLMLRVAPFIGAGTLSPVGTVALIISSVSWALGSLYSSRALLPVSILASSAMLLITGGLMLSAISLLLGEYHSFELSLISAQSLRMLIYLTAAMCVILAGVAMMVTRPDKGKKNK